MVPGAPDLDGRVIIVTGAGRGIGRGIAEHVASRGARVVVAEWREEHCLEAAAAVTDAGGEAIGVVTDVMDRDGIGAMIARTVDEWGRIDALVNNAHTFMPNRPLLEVSADEVDTHVRSAVLGSLWCMQAVHPHMAAAGWGRVVNFVSAAGIRGMPGYGAYNVAKEGVRALTRTAAREWGRDGIVVNAVAPAAASERGARAAAEQTDAYREFIRDHPVGRQGDPRDDIAPVVAFLCSDACRYLTGQTFMVDGGAFIHG